MNERLENDLKAVGLGIGIGVAGFLAKDYIGNVNERLERERELRNRLVLTIEALQNPTATLEPEITFSPTPTLTTTPSVTNTNTATPTNTLPPTLTSLPMLVQEPSATTEPSATREQIGSGVDVLGPNAVIPDSVWPGGVSWEFTGFSLDEAATVAEIYNGTTAQTNNPLNQQKLAAARAFAESIFGVRGTINVNTLTLHTDGYWVTGSSDGNEVLVFRIYKEQAPPGYTYNQIAVEDSRPGTAYVNNGSLIGGEFLYVVEVYNAGTGVLENTLIYRSACGNIGGPTVLPQPTPGATVTLMPSPTQPLWPTDTRTPRVPSTITSQPPEATITPVLPTATIPPTMTSQRPEPTITPG